MRIFVTGATGFIGSAVVQDLLAAGHQVLGLARSPSGAEQLSAAGAEVHHGGLEDLDSLRGGAAACDGVVHTAFIHDFSKFKESCEVDRRAIEAMGNALAGSARPLVVTSGTALLASERPALEQTPAPSGPNVVPRVASEQAAAAMVERGVNVSVVRLSPSVHGNGDHGFVPMIIGFARKNGVSAYVGDGSNVWPAVHRLDAARLFRLAVEKGQAGARYHGAAEAGVPFRQIAETIGKQLGLPTRGLAADAAAKHFEWFTHFAMIDNPTSSAWTRETLGWSPTGPGLIADLDRPAYFTEA